MLGCNEATPHPDTPQGDVYYESCFQTWLESGDGSVRPAPDVLSAHALLHALVSLYGMAHVARAMLQVEGGDGDGEAGHGLPPSGPTRGRQQGAAGAGGLYTVLSTLLTEDAGAVDYELLRTVLEESCQTGGGFGRARSTTTTLESHLDTTHPLHPLYHALSMPMCLAQTPSVSGDMAQEQTSNAALTVLVALYNRARADFGGVLGDSLTDTQDNTALVGKGPTLVRGPAARSRYETVGKNRLVDGEFPLQLESVGTPSFPAYDQCFWWRRITKLDKKACVMPEKGDLLSFRSDHRTGLLQAMCSTVHMCPGLLENLYQRELSSVQLGIHTFKFFLNGSWQSVCVDDYLPVNETYRPLFSRADRHMYLIPLLEKAVAKVAGSYELAHSLTLDQCVSLLFAGFIAEAPKLLRRGAAGLYDSLKLLTETNARKATKVACLLSGPAESQTALTPSAFYSVLKVVRIPIVQPVDGGEPDMFSTDALPAPSSLEHFVVISMVNAEEGYTGPYNWSDDIWSVPGNVAALESRVTHTGKAGGGQIHIVPVSSLPSLFTSACVVHLPTQHRHLIQIPGRWTLQNSGGPKGMGAGQNPVIVFQLNETETQPSRGTLVVHPYPDPLPEQVVKGEDGEVVETQATLESELDVGAGFRLFKKTLADVIFDSALFTEGQSTGVEGTFLPETLYAVQPFLSEKGLGGDFTVLIGSDGVLEVQ
ncbi:peptidase C2, calpain family [Kipferlia bialata]|uniref:Peptidase C2, calpain family n=1 Tax=Kipferlia bialata TaxID=797122 RepID=A0A9K3CP19_9EUKA|nr:peptidase C2, calpain family [Kipferlia bialata]|eukprot:g455.t1